jgi:hypothetical protein
MIEREPMLEQATFLKSAAFIAKRNVNAAVTKVAVQFDAINQHLLVIYCLDRPATDDEIEWCELTCGELCATFTEIRTAETEICESEEAWKAKVGDAVMVYSRES